MCHFHCRLIRGSQPSPQCVSSASNIINRDKLHFYLVRLRPHRVWFNDSKRERRESGIEFIDIAHCSHRLHSNTRQKCQSRHEQRRRVEPEQSPSLAKKNSNQKRSGNSLLYNKRAANVRHLFNSPSLSLALLVSALFSISIFFPFSSLLDFRLFSLFFNGESGTYYVLVCLTLCFFVCLRRFSLWRTRGATFVFLLLRSLYVLSVR